MKKVALPSLLILLLTAQVFGSAENIPLQAQISPQALVRILQSNQGRKVLILNVGPRMLYTQAHITGAVFIGPANDPRGIDNLRQRVKSEPKNKQIVIYCGCCPWDHCPNVEPAFLELRKLGFHNVKVLHISNNFGADWVDKDYPTERGR